MMERIIQLASKSPLESALSFLGSTPRESRGTQEWPLFSGCCPDNGFVATLHGRMCLCLGVSYFCSSDSVCISLWGEATKYEF